MKPSRILKLPHPKLKQISQYIVYDTDLIPFIEAMFEEMYKAKGVGLAAVQLGVMQRIAVMDTGTNGKKRVFINPQILHQKGMQHATEGCLSVNDPHAHLIRAEEVIVRYINIKGEEVVETLTGLEARCIQHEVDHMEGLTYLDRLKPWFS